MVVLCVIVLLRVGLFVAVDVGLLLQQGELKHHSGKPTL